MMTQTELYSILDTVYDDIGARKVQQCRENLPAAMAEYDQLSSNHQPTFSLDSSMFSS